MGDFSDYMRAQAERREAYAEYSAASLKLELAKIRERFAEIQSQHEPLNALTDGDRVEREKHIKTARYVVTGRMVD